MKIYPQKLVKIFNNPIYCGILVHKRLEGEIVEGKHKPIVSRNLFLRANGIRKDHHAAGWTHSKEFPDTPLKRLLLCGGCGKPMTSYSRSKKKKRLKSGEVKEYRYSNTYHYYKCSTKGCRVNVNATRMHESFVSVLNCHQLAPCFISLARKQLLLTFEELNKGKASIVAGLQKKVRELQRKIDEADERVFSGQLPGEVYQKFVPKLREEKAELQAEIERQSLKLSTPRKFIDRALEIASNLAPMWENGMYWERKQLQNLVFPQGLVFDPEKGIFRTPRLNSIFAAFRSLNREKEKGSLLEIEPRSPQAERGGFEPPIHIAAYAGLANRWFQPLTHLSG